MADQKLTDRPEIDAVADGDLFHIVDVSDATDGANGTSKKVPWTKLTYKEKEKFNYIYVADYDIDITGVVSSADAVQSALDDATEENNIVVFPVGKLLVQNLVIKSNTKIIATGCVFQYGGGNPSSYVLFSENTQDGIFHGRGVDANTLALNIEIDGGEYIGVRSPNDWTTFTSHDAIQMVWIDGLTIKNTIVRDWGQDGIEIKGCNNVLIDGNTIIDVVDSGIEVRAGFNCIVSNNTTLRTRNLFVYKNYQMIGSPYTTYSGSNLKLINNTGEYFGSGILFHWINNSTIDNNYLKAISVTGETGTDKVGITLDKHASVPNPTTMENITVSNNTIEGITDNTGILVKALATPQENIKVINNSIITSTSTDYSIDYQSTGEVRANYMYNGILFIGRGNAQISKNTASNIVVGAGTEDFDYSIKDNVFTDNINIGEILGSYEIESNSCSSITTVAGVDDINIISNKILSTSGTSITVSGDNINILNNEINSTTTGNAASVAGEYNVIKGNTINLVGGTGAPLYLYSTANFASIKDNRINSTSSGADIHLFSSDSYVSGNILEGGNHGMKVVGDRNKVVNNTIKDTNFTGVQTDANADATRVNSNVFISVPTDVNDLGTNTINGLEENSYKLSALNTAPSSASDTGTLGEIRYDDTYMYLCVATDTWKRSELTTW